MSEKISHFPLSIGLTLENVKEPYDLFVLFAEHEHDQGYEGYTKVAADLMRKLKYAEQLSRSGQFHKINLEMPVGMDREQAEKYVYDYSADAEPEGAKIMMEAAKKFTDAKLEPSSYRHSQTGEGVEVWHGKLPDSDGRLTNTDVYWVIEQHDGNVGWRMRSEPLAAQLAQAA